MHHRLYEFGCVVFFLHDRAFVIQVPNRKSLMCIVPGMFSRASLFVRGTPSNPDDDSVSTVRSFVRTWLKVVGQEISPSQVKPDRGWFTVHPRGTHTKLEAHREPLGSNGSRVTNPIRGPKIAHVSATARLSRSFFLIVVVDKPSLPPLPPSAAASSP